MGDGGGRVCRCARPATRDLYDGFVAALSFCRQLSRASGGGADCDGGVVAGGSAATSAGRYARCTAFDGDCEAAALCCSGDLRRDQLRSDEFHYDVGASGDETVRTLGDRF